MILIKKLSKSYHKTTLFEQVSLSLNDGNIYALVGVNGIGKSTFMNCITQPSYMNSGEIYIDNTSNKSFDSRYRFFFLPDIKDMFLNLTGIEYLSFIVEIYRQDYSRSKDKIKAITTKLKINDSLSNYLSSYSLGMKQKLFLTGALISGATNLILDEPFNGLDPESCVLVKQLLHDHCKSHTNMILYSIHNLDLVSNFSNYIIFIDKHRKIFTMKNNKNIDELENIFIEAKKGL